MNSQQLDELIFAKADQLCMRQVIAQLTDFLEPGELEELSEIIND